MPVLTNAKVHMDGLAIADQANQVDLKYSAAMLDDTTFADALAGTKIYAPGTVAATADYKGLFRGGVPDGILDAGVGGGCVLSVAPRGWAGDLTYFMQAREATLERSGSVAALLAVAGHFESRGLPLLRGTVAAFGQTGAGVANQFLHTHAMQATAYALDATTLPAGSAARRVSLTHASTGATDTLGSAHLVGTADDGSAVTEDVALSADATVISLKAFKTLTAVTTAAWVTNAGADTLTIGFADRGVALNLGAVVAPAQLYAVLHVLDIPVGTLPTLDVVVDSDDAQAFDDPTTRVTFTQMTARGAQYAVPVATPITDTWWRVRWTVGGTVNPAFKISAALAIQ